jgi:hypothetical protein
VRRLLGSPALVKSLTGVERSVAVSSYEAALKVIFSAGVGLALLMVIVQAATGWENGEKESTSDSERASLVGVEDEWEDGLEEGA